MEAAQRDEAATDTDLPSCSVGEERATLPCEAEARGLQGERGRVGKSAPALGQVHTGSNRNDIPVKLIMKRQTTGLPDILQQDLLRGKLRILENDRGEVVTLLRELSARLVSIYSDQDLIMITFKTFEEIWKFSTYYSLGFVGNCMENLLLDQDFWLDRLNEDAMIEFMIDVQINEDSLKMMGKHLLQEGVFFLRYPFSHQAHEEEPQLKIKDFVAVEKAENGSKSFGESPVSRKNILVPNSHVDFFDPFHQWFFQRYPERLVASNEAAEFSCPLGTGSCVAVVDVEGFGLEELSFQIGDRILIIGLLSTCMQWFLGKHEASGKTGFVKISHVKPDDLKPLAKGLLFIYEAEKYVFANCERFTAEDSIESIEQMAETDIDMVYQMDMLEPMNSQKSEKGETDTPSKLEIEVVKAKLNEAACGLIETDYLTSGSEKAEIEQDSTTCADGPTFDESQKPQFHVGDVQELDNTEILCLLIFLDNEEFSKHFQNLYDFSFSFLTSTFYGYGEVKELVHYLEVAREAARKRQMQWAQTRLCFLLGRICAKKLKFSQARVYFEEALCLMKGRFTDLFLLIAVYTNLVAIYLKQKNNEKCSALFGKIAALLLGISNYICSSGAEAEILRSILKRAVLAEDRLVEARACFLLAKLHINLEQYDDGLPFIERLQCLRNVIMLESEISLDFYFTLGSLYYQKCLPNLAISCVKCSCLRPTRTLMDCLKSINFIMKGASKLCGKLRVTALIPPQVVSCLQWALCSASGHDQGSINRTICLSLSKIYKLHGKYEKAIHYLEMAINGVASANAVEMINALVSLAWLHILNCQPAKAMIFLNSLLEFPSVLNSPVKQGVVYNMIAISMRKMNNVKEAIKSYVAALLTSLNSGIVRNQAIVNANFGLLCLWSKAHQLSEHLLLKSIHLFFKLQNVSSDKNLIQVLMMLGHHYIDQELQENGIFCYECALLIALKANLIESQVQVTQSLWQFYSSILPNETQCIVYNEFLLSLARTLMNKELEGHVLQNTSQHYLNLGTERAFRSALEYTKESLGIFIDLKIKEKEACAWLQAGKTYYVLGKNELVDLYIQVAQDTAKSTQKLEFAMEISEAAGDIFFNGSQEREKAISFYRDHALPIALKVENTKVELRLCNKLIELLLNVNIFSEALKYAQMALTLSVALEFDEETIYYVRVYVQLGDMMFFALKDPYDAAGYYHLALAAAMDLGSKKSQLKICTRLATIYHNFLVDREMSLYYYQKARKFATELNIRRLNLSPVQYYKTTAVTISKSHT
ncbi:SH3 domain and tetratricopeptide repeat-containing protein 1 isoform X2 [Narcine bancroftii]|uniref:SH3 domain and tetratricopeptide repeat-containing protein 1 isoform X2 n=1 Tax=Narcine bancroftii TaxID=1343680 RepID=UPI003831ACF5